MHRSLTALMVLAFASVVNAAEPPCDARSPAAGCDQRCTTCQQPCQTRHVYVKVPPRDQPSEEDFEEETGPPRNESSVTPGAFVAPPPMGTSVGETRSVGVNGIAIHFPSWSLRLPTIEFPGLTRSRTNAHMRLESAVAPFVATGHGVGAFGGMPAGFAGRATAQETALADEETGPMDDETAPSDDESATLDCKSSSESARLNQELDERLRVIKEKEKCLEEMLKQYKECLDNIQDEMVIPKPEYDAGARDTGLQDPYLSSREPMILRHLPPTAQPPEDNGIRQSNYETRQPVRLPRPTTPKMRRLPRP